MFSLIQTQILVDLPAAISSLIIKPNQLLQSHLIVFISTNFYLIQSFVGIIRPNFYKLYLDFRRKESE